MIKFDKATFCIKCNNKNINNNDNNNDKLNKKQENKEIKKEYELKEIYSDKNNKEELLINKDVKLDINSLQKNEGENQANKDIILLKNISIEIKKGEFVIILGPTGSGKSSLFNAILNNCHLYSLRSLEVILLKDSKIFCTVKNIKKINIKIKKNWIKII